MSFVQFLSTLPGTMQPDRSFQSFASRYRQSSFTYDVKRDVYNEENFQQEHRKKTASSGNVDIDISTVSHHVQCRCVRAVIQPRPRWQPQNYLLPLVPASVFLFWIPVLRTPSIISLQLFFVGLFLCVWFVLYRLLLKFLFNFLFMAVPDICRCTRASSSCGQWGLLSSCGAWASHSSGFSWCGTEAVRFLGSVVWCMDLAAPRHVESSPTRDQSHVPALAGRFLTTGPPGKFLVSPSWL